MPITGYVMKKPQRRLPAGFPQRLARPRAGMATTSPRRGIFREYRWYKTVAVACCLVPSGISLRDRIMENPAGFSF